MTGYALVGALVTGVVAALTGLLVSAGPARAIWQGGLTAYVIQTVAFALLMWTSGKWNFMAAWGIGTLVRLASVFAVGLAIWRGVMGGEEVAALLLSLAGFLFMLLMLEAVFFRKGLQSQ